MLQTFWQEILTVWQIGILNTTLGDIFIALGVFLTFLFVRRIFFRSFSRTLQRLTGRTKKDIDFDIEVVSKRAHPYKVKKL